MDYNPWIWGAEAGGSMSASATDGVWGQPGYTKALPEADTPAALPYPWRLSNLSCHFSCSNSSLYGSLVTWRDIQYCIFWDEVYSQFLPILHICTAQCLIGKNIVIIVCFTFNFHLIKNDKTKLEIKNSNSWSPKQWQFLTGKVSGWALFIPVRKPS